MQIIWDGTPTYGRHLCVEEEIRREPAQGCLSAYRPTTNYKLTPAHVAEIRERFASGESASTIAPAYLVSVRTIYYVCQEKG